MAPENREHILIKIQENKGRSGYSIKRKGVWRIVSLWVSRGHQMARAGHCQKKLTYNKKEEKDDESD